jgi:hypothetical protein
MSDRLLRAYVRLKALRSHVNHFYVPETYVVEYHEILDQVETTGVDVEEFRIQLQQLNHRVTSWNAISGRRTYSNERFVSGAFFRSKLDAVLMYFGFATSADESPREIGFRVPRASED